MLSAHPMARFGLFLNNRGAVIDAERYTLASLLALAARAEELDFDFVAVGDSVLAKPRFAPIPTLAAMAAVTTRIELTTGVLQPHLRPPVQLAQEWATLDALSGGRTSLGVGLGSGSRDLVAAELSGILRPEEWAVLWARLRAAGEAAGRDLAAKTFERRFSTYIHVGNDRGAARWEGRQFMGTYYKLRLDDATLDRWLIHGSAADCAARLSELIDAVVNSFQFVLASADQMTQLERLSDTLSVILPGES